MTLFLVSNRLPVSIRRRASRYDLQPSVGGLASGLGSVYREHHAQWVGWPGDVPPRSRRVLAKRLRSEFGYLPVFLPTELSRRYYGGFSNGTLWPLFHSFSTYARYAPADWEAYREANETFAERIAEVAGPRDTIWVHDYHLLLLPRLLRERMPDARIGFFLHVPFPPYDVLRVLPWQREILEGLLGADLIGFHTYDYAQAFLGSLRRSLGVDNELGSLAWGNRSVQVDVFPMGVDFARYARDRPRGTAAERIAALVRGPGVQKTIFSVSRLDYTKGIPEQVEAYGRFLERYPTWRGKVVYLLAVVPSREIVQQYAELKRTIDELVGRINSRYGSMVHTPIRYVYRALSDEELLALYRLSDVALVAPLRDGMNLVAKEYLAARTDGRGVLVLSEMAGSAKELTEALLVNPNHVDEMADALHAALTMPAEEQVRRNEPMRRRLAEHDLKGWASSFLARLDETRKRSEILAVRFLSPSARSAINEAYARAERRLLLLDYDGTLVSFSDQPRQAFPTPLVVERLKALAASPRNTVVLLSGRRKEDLEAWFGGLGAVLVAEHGAWTRSPGDSRWEPTVVLDDRWKERIRPLLQLFVDRVPGSSIEEKDHALAWHFRRVAASTGFAAAADLTEALTNLTANSDLHVLLGSKVVEIKSSRFSKGIYFTTRLAERPWDFIFAAGDDWTDESLFEVLPPTAVSVRVGFTGSAARYNVGSAEDVLALLQGFSRIQDVASARRKETR